LFYTLSPDCFFLNSARTERIFCFDFCCCRGRFRIRNEKKSIAVELQAHLSTKACLKAWNTASILPQLLHIDILSMSDAWPPMFQITPPTDEHITLYFFPEHERWPSSLIFDFLLSIFAFSFWLICSITGMKELSTAL